MVEQRLDVSYQCRVTPLARRIRVAVARAVERNDAQPGLGKGFQIGRSHHFASRTRIAVEIEEDRGIAPADIRIAETAAIGQLHERVDRCSGASPTSLC